jgi:hypothetical protein
MAQWELATRIHINNAGSIVYDSRVPLEWGNSEQFERLMSCIEDNIVCDDGGSEIIDWENVERDYSAQ